MSTRSIIVVILLAITAFLATQTFYTVDPTKQVLVRQFGAIVGEPKTDPGLYTKVPLVQDIQRIDRSASSSTPMPASRSWRPRPSRPPCRAANRRSVACWIR